MKKIVLNEETLEQLEEYDSAAALYLRMKAGVSFSEGEDKLKPLEIREDDSSYRIKVGKVSFSYEGAYLERERVFILNKENLEVLLILLLTSPSSVCRLVAELIQQARQENEKKTQEIKTAPEDFSQIAKLIETAFTTKSQKTITPYPINWKRLRSRFFTGLFLIVWGSFLIYSLST